MRLLEDWIMTMKEAAKACGLSETALKRLESNGKFPRHFRADMRPEAEGPAKNPKRLYSGREVEAFARNLIRQGKAGKVAQPGNWSPPSLEGLEGQDRTA